MIYIPKVTPILSLDLDRPICFGTNIKGTCLPLRTGLIRILIRQSRSNLKFEILERIRTPWCIVPPADRLYNWNFQVIHLFFTEIFIIFPLFLINKKIFFIIIINKILLWAPLSFPFPLPLTSLSLHYF